MRLFRTPVGSDGARMGLFRAPVGSEWAIRGLFWAPVGSEWARMGLFRAPVGSERARMSPSGTIWDHLEAQVAPRRAIFGHLEAKVASKCGSKFVCFAQSTFSPIFWRALWTQCFDFFAESTFSLIFWRHLWPRSLAWNCHVSLSRRFPWYFEGLCGHEVSTFSLSRRFPWYVEGTFRWVDVFPGLKPLLNVTLPWRAGFPTRGARDLRTDFLNRCMKFEGFGFMDFDVFSWIL